jgi:hypothetical protein
VVVVILVVVVVVVIDLWDYKSLQQVCRLYIFW